MGVVFVATFTVFGIAFQYWMVVAFVYCLIALLRFSIE
jgi:hypothetical protein